MSNTSKSSVWKSVFQLLLSEKKKFTIVVIISLLGTGISLVEPLIYREAINDVSGLFVRQAREDALIQHGDSSDVSGDADDDALTGFIEKKIGFKEPHQKGHVASRTPQQAMETLLWAVGLIFLVNMISHLLQWAGENMNVRMACSIEQNFISRTFNHVLKLPLTFFSKRSSAALGKQINQSEEVSEVVNGFSQSILPELISLIGILAIMFSQHITLTLIAISVIPFYLLVAWRSANKLETGLSEYYDRWEEVSTRMQDALGGIKTVKLSGAEQREVAKFKEISDIAYKEYVNRSKLANRYLFIENMLTTVASALVLGYGGYLTLENQLTPGDVVMFVAYLDRLYQPIDTLSSLWVSMQQNIASMMRANKLLHSGSEEKKGKPLHVTAGRIEFQDVHFGYHKDKEILKGVSFVMEPGKATALVGSSGAGKTTTVDLMMKLFENYKGTITIDGTDIRHTDPASLRSQIGMIATDGAIFRGTLADNIRYKRSDATDEDVMSAAVAAGLKTTLSRLPEGLKTSVGESGFGLSVGERQRIQIARMLVSKPKILIMDEATANLDYATEAEVKKTVDEIRKHNTVIIIAHRYSMVKDADHVIVMANGQVLEQGPPHELLAKKGWFEGFAKAADE